MTRYARDFGWHLQQMPRGYGREFGPGARRGGYDLSYRGEPRGAGFGGGGGARYHRPPMRAADIMTEEPEAVTADTAIADAARLMRELDVGILPVVDDLDSRRLRGVITDRDIAIRAVAEGKNGGARVAECMTHDVESCGENDRVQDVLDVMRGGQVRRVPITDRDGRLVGIVAQADLAVAYAGLDRNREIEVEEAIERISEPAQLQRQWSTLRGRWR